MLKSDIQISEKTKEYILKIRNKFQSIDGAQNQGKTISLKKKDPLSLFELRSDVQPIRVGDSFVESIGKLYRLLKRRDEQDILQHELDIDRQEGQIEEEDRNNEKLLREIKKKSGKTKNIEKEKKDNIFGKIKDLISVVINKIKDIVGGITKLLSGIGEKLVSGVKSLVGGISPLKSLIGGTTALALSSMKGSVPKKPVYDYIRSKGVDHIHAMGMMTNIEGESGFRPGVLGDNGTSGGLFQWHNERLGKMSQSIPDWQTNWKAQIDYALSDKEGNVDKYFATPYASSEEATTGWVKYFERPKDPVAASATRRSYVPEMEKVVGSSTIEKTNNESKTEAANNISQTKIENQIPEPKKEETKQTVTKVASVEVPKTQTTPAATSTPVVHQQPPSEVDAKQTKIDAKTVSLIAGGQNIGEKMLNTSIDNKVWTMGRNNKQNNIVQTNYIIKPGDRKIIYTEK